MTYQETLDYLFNALPMYQRIGAAAYKADLHNTLQLCTHLGNPQHLFKSIHIGGTNGKGSTSHALASILQEAGYKVGLYTSPHLKSFTERIKVNGEEIDEEKVIAFVERHRDFLDGLHPSFFEMTVGMAFNHFAEEKVDYAVIEVGLGGRLDSTNVLLPELCVITNIGLDHVQFLGNTLPRIAIEKAGIIKEKIPVVISETQPETKGVFEKIAKEKNAPIYFADQHYQIKQIDPDPTDPLCQYEVITGNKDKEYYHMDISARYQEKNLPGIFQAISILKEKGLKIDQDAIKGGLGRITKNTGLKGRWQKLGEDPLIYCDTGHNADGIKLLVDQITRIPFKNLFIIIGMSNDKDIDPVLALLPKKAFYVFCEANIPRAMPAVMLHEKAMKFGLLGEVVSEVNQALRTVLKKADKDDFIFVGGSTFVVAELENL
ncbi:MAG: folylpolyglutamate synthase/dihydrofolate synthase family protein [Anditalea sp.]